VSGIVLQPEETLLSRIVGSIIQLAQGRLNCVGEVTLRANQTTTTVTLSVSKAAVNVGSDCQVFLSPKTANAAAAVPTTWISSVGQGTFEITHANAVTVDRTFGWTAVG
jgi:hypothetical protein